MHLTAQLSTHHNACVSSCQTVQPLYVSPLSLRQETHEEEGYILEGCPEHDIVRPGSAMVQKWFIFDLTNWSSYFQ
jgi:hypothetical protein